MRGGAPFARASAPCPCQQLLCPHPQLRIMHKGPCRSARAGRRGKAPRRIRVTAEEFQEERRKACMSRSEVAALVGVSLRTVGHWETGQARPSFAAFKLLRVSRNGGIVDARWAGYGINRRGMLYTPENHEFHSGDLAWLSLLVRRSRAFSDLLSERAAAAAVSRPRREARPGAAAVAAPVLQGSSSSGEGGRAAVALGLVYSPTSDTQKCQSPAAVGFQASWHGAIMGPQWGHESDQARTKQAQSADAAGPTGGSRSRSPSHGGEPQCLLPPGTAELHPVHPAADAPLDCGQPCAEADTDAGGRVIDCPFSGCQQVAEGGPERSVSLRFGPQGQAVPPGSLLMAGGAL